MAIQEHGGSSGDGLYPPPSPEEKTIGRQIQAGELPIEVERELTPHHSNWLIVEKSDAKELRESDKFKFFANIGGHWTDKVRDGREASRHDEWYAFEKKPTQKTSGGGAAKNNNSMYIPAGLGQETFLNLDPTVRISTPQSGGELKLNNNTPFKNNLTQHTFVEGDTVSSVAKQYSGSDNPEAIYNFNPRYSARLRPQTGDTVRVLAGRELKVDGSVQNSASVTLSWQGPTSGTQTLDNTKGGKNETVSWETTIPAKAGDYHLTANASGATSNTVTLKVIDPNAHWIRFNLFDENDKLVKEKKLDYLVRFDDGTEIRSQLKNGTDYLTSVPFFPFTIEIIPGKELNDKLAVLRERLRTELATSIAQVKADTARHEKEWAKIGNVEAGFIYLGSGLTGAGEWVVDTVKGVTELATGIVDANITTYAWAGKYINHRVSAFASYANGDVEGLRKGVQLTFKSYWGAHRLGTIIWSKNTDQIRHQGVGSRYRHKQSVFLCHH
ncbi:hypothetical protein MNBD_GAMMA21-1011 [hydrothermal vent metagenome]|uniref:LysM domain-containing protein n=1 Tax=hydrothermal vent metagenome TaxID=652676 RepID=A0A3B1ADL9_9ZZZZ